MTVTEADIDRYIQLLGANPGEPGQDRMRERARRDLEYRAIMLENQTKLRERGMGMFWKY